MIVDLAMTVLLFCLMAYLLVGETAHEWMGVTMFCLVILHHVLNWNWHRHLIKGRYTPLRILQTGIDVLILLSMIGLMVSGIVMSREVFDFLPISGGMGFARSLHMLASDWGFLFMSLHLGLHWSMMMGMMRISSSACSVLVTFLLVSALSMMSRVSSSCATDWLYSPNSLS